MSQPTTTETTATAYRRDNGTWKVTTRRGAQVAHHEKLTEAQAEAIMADPAAHHATTWSHSLMRAGIVR